MTQTANNVGHHCTTGDWTNNKTHLTKKARRLAERLSEPY